MLPPGSYHFPASSDEPMNLIPARLRRGGGVAMPCGEARPCGLGRWLSRALVPALLAAALVLGTSSVRAAQSVGLRLMPLGDSITRGYKSTTEDGYRAPLSTALKNRGIALDFVGSQRCGALLNSDVEGYNGYRIDQITALVDTALATYHPNLITLHIGTNDLAQNYQAATASKRLAALIDQIIADDPKVTILVAQLVCNATPSVQSLIDAYNAKIPEIVQSRAKAGKHVYLVSMKALTKADLADGLHPNDVGYQKMADAWDAGIQQAIAGGKVAPVDFAGVFEIDNLESGLAADVFGRSGDNGARIIQWQSTGNSNQLWTLIPTSDGYYQIKNAGSGLDLNVAGASKEGGAKIVQWQFGQDGNDQWLPVLQPDGSYTFANRNSGLLLDNPGGSTPETQLDQAEPGGGSNQKFKLVPR